MISITRDHGHSDPTGSTIATRLLGQTICMHAAYGPARPAQTTCSLVVHIRKDKRATLWVTGSSAPCTSVFKPIVGIDATPQDVSDAVPGSKSDSTLWWTHEKLHREVIVDYLHRLALYKAERDSLEVEFISLEKSLAEKGEYDLEARRNFTQECFQQTHHATLNWLQLVKQEPIKHGTPLRYACTWNGINKKANVPTQLPIFTKGRVGLLVSAIVVGVGIVLAYKSLKS